MSSNSPPQEGKFFLLVSFLVLVQLRCILMDPWLGLLPSRCWGVSNLGIDCFSVPCVKTHASTLPRV